MPASTITISQRLTPFSERNEKYISVRNNKQKFVGYCLLCNPQKSNLPAESSQRRGWPQMVVSRRKSKGTILMIKAMRWSIHPTNKVCGTERPSSGWNVSVMKDLGTLKYRPADHESEVSTTTTIFFDFLYVVTRYCYFRRHPLHPRTRLHHQQSVGDLTRTVCQQCCC